MFKGHTCQGKPIIINSAGWLVGLQALSIDSVQMFPTPLLGTSCLFDKYENMSNTLLLRYLHLRKLSLSDQWFCKPLRPFIPQPRCLSLSLCCCDKAPTKNNPEWKRVLFGLQGTTPSSREAKQELKAGNSCKSWGRDNGVMLDPALLSVSWWVWFGLEPRTTCQGWHHLQMAGSSHSKH